MLRIQCAALLTALASFACLSPASSTQSQSSTQSSSTSTTRQLASTTVTTPAPTLSLASANPSPGSLEKISILASDLPTSSGSTVTLYDDATCTHVLSGPTSTAGNSQITFTPTNSVAGEYPYSAKAHDGALGVDSACSSAISYYLTPLAGPYALTLQGPTTPTGYSTTPVIRVDGVQLGETIHIYSNATCSSAVTTSSVYSTSQYVTLPVQAVGSHTYYATVTETGYLSSNCSLASVNYQVLTPPVPSAITMVVPSTNSDTNQEPTVQVVGVASGLLVKLYAVTNPIPPDPCASTAVGSVQATGSTVMITVSSPLAVGSYTLYADTRWNESTGTSTSSACSTANQAYAVVTPPAPDAPVLYSPSNNYSPTPTYNITGVSAGLTVTLYGDNACSNAVGRAVATSGSVLITYDPSIAGASLSYGMTYKFYAAASNGTSSPCSAASLAYTYSQPLAPTSLSMHDPGTISGYYQTPVVRVNGTQSGDTVTLYAETAPTGSDCAGSPVGTTTANNTTVDVQVASRLLTGPTGTTYYFYATNTRPEGAVSPCSNDSAQATYELNPPVQITQTKTLGVSGTPRQIAVGDFNSDSNNDLVVTNSDSGGSSSPLTVLLGDGTGTFTYASAPPDTGSAGSVSVAVGTFNQDYDEWAYDTDLLDIMTTSATDPAQALLFVNSDGPPAAFQTSFNSPGSYYAGDDSTEVAKFIVSADFDNDDYSDVAIANGQENGASQGPGSITVIYSKGNTNFYTSSTFGHDIFSYSALVAADVNGDGKMDLVAGIGQNVRVFLGKGDGTFQDPVDFPTSQPVIGLAVDSQTGCIRWPSVGACEVTASIPNIYAAHSTGFSYLENDRTTDCKTEDGSGNCTDYESTWTGLYSPLFTAAPSDLVGNGGVTSIAVDTLNGTYDVALTYSNEPYISVFPGDGGIEGPFLHSYDIALPYYFVLGLGFREYTTTADHGSVVTSKLVKQGAGSYAAGTCNDPSDNCPYSDIAVLIHAGNSNFVTILTNGTPGGLF